MRKIEQPVTIAKQGPGGAKEEVTTHPAFAQIVAARVSGHAALYGSDFRHNAYMTIRIKRSQIHRHLNHDWYFGTEPIIEIALSEAQWATFVSSTNIGDGVPCTILNLDWEMTPELPDPASRVDQFNGEMAARLKDAISKAEAAIAGVDALGLSRARAEAVKGPLARLVMELRHTLPFVARQFAEHTETTVEKAKQEIHGYMTAVVQRAGIAALSGGKLPLQIEDDTP